HFAHLTNTHGIRAHGGMSHQAREVVAAWLEREQVRILSPTLNTFHLFFDLLEEADTGGNLSTDAMIASIALEHGGRVLSNDNDFSRFSALVWHNPIASKG
ncbi:MAG: PIN domain-containing protein, partial [Myxococcota bacterium]